MSAPDLRILQANERTFLAWVRTGISLLVFGFALARVAVWLEPLGKDGAGKTSEGLIVGIGIGLVIVGAFLPAFSAIRHARIRDAILQGKPIIPSGRATVAVAGILLTAGLALAVWLMLV